MNDVIAKLTQDHDFLIDAWVRGMCDSSEVEDAARRLEAAKRDSLDNALEPRP